MALRWFLHSLVYQPDDMQYCKNMATKMHLASGFQMPLHYLRYMKVDYEKMEWKVDMLLREYGLSLEGNLSLDEKRAYAMGTF
ncbi:hypothetical protein V6Z11_A06G184200 [Gossypium hirsutum]